MSIATPAAPQKAAPPLLLPSSAGRSRGEMLKLALDAAAVCTPDAKRAAGGRSHSPEEERARGKRGPGEGGAAGGAAGGAGGECGGARLRPRKLSKRSLFSPGA